MELESSDKEWGTSVCLDPTQAWLAGLTRAAAAAAAAALRAPWNSALLKYPDLGSTLPTPLAYTGTYPRDASWQP